MEKLTEKQTEVETVMSEVSGFPLPQLDPRVLDVYKGVREVRAERAAMVIPFQGQWAPASGTDAHTSSNKARSSRIGSSQSVWVRVPALPLCGL